MMKNLFAVVLALLLSLSLAGCDKLLPTKEVSQTDREDVLEKDVIYPLYDSLNKKDRQIYLNICSAVMEFRDSAVIAVYDSEEELEEALETVSSLYRQIFFEQSEIFWVDPYNVSMEYVQYGKEYRLSIRPGYLVSEKKAKKMKASFEDTLEEIVSQAEDYDETFEQVLFVYDYILNRTEYDYALAEKNDYDNVGINAYGCLLEGKTICSGYAMAFDAVMKRLGYECGVEFNNYSNFSAFEGHVWNYCKLGKEYYYFDLTWDDTSFDSEVYQKYMAYGHTYFGVSKEELSKSNNLMTEDAPTPECKGTEFNYYVYKGLNISVYTEEAVKAALDAQAGQSFAMLRFDSYGELLKAQSELIDGQKIYTMLPEVDSLSYTVSKSNLHLFLFFEE